MFKVFVYVDGMEVGTETVAAEDLQDTKDYLTDLGFDVETEKLS